MRKLNESYKVGDSVNEAKDMSFNDYLKILDKKFIDVMKAVNGENGSDNKITPTRGDILQNFTLFRNYLSSLSKKYSNDKTKLRFITEYSNKLNNIQKTLNEARKDREIVNKVLGKDFQYDYSMKGTQLIIRKDKYNNDGTLGTMKDSDRNDIIKKFRKHDIVAKPNMGGGVTAYIKESINEDGVPIKDLIKKMPDHVKGWAKYVAQHKNGEWWYYDSVPKLVPNTGWKSWDRDGYQFSSNVKTNPKGWESSQQKLNESINEAIEPEDYVELRQLIRQEIASVFFDLFKKRSAWK